MKSSVIRLIAACALLALASTGASAQKVYRIVGPDGRITFSDQPPQDADTKATTTTVGGAGGGSNLAALPFELRQVATRYPVTLYTGNNCAPCGSGRALLAGRGVPFTERTVTTNEDTEALQRLTGGEGGLPLLTIGTQQIKGFSDAEWTQFLDAAGYPQTSALPANYRNAAPAPLVAVKRPDPPPPAAGATAEQSDAKPATPARRPPRNAQGSGQAPEAESNPSGIRF